MKVNKVVFGNAALVIEGNVAILSVVQKDGNVESVIMSYEQAEQLLSVWSRLCSEHLMEEL